MTTASVPRDRSARIGMSQAVQEDDLALDAALIAMVRIGASDLHLTTGAPPMIRVSGSLRPLDDFTVLTSDALKRSIFAVLTQKQREAFEAELELDFAYAVRGVAR
ncbi:MAG TPA: type IV pili twitching motility protein PilT, partial [Cellulomonas sp.]